MKKAIVLLSGGIDSTTSLYWALSKKYHCICLIFSYGQRHLREIKSAVKIAKLNNCKYFVLKLPILPLGSSLTNKTKPIPSRKLDQIYKDKLPPSTYVPARNIIFLSFAFSYAEIFNAGAIIIGANALDYSGYPDCRPEFFQAMEKSFFVGTKSGILSKKIKILTPLIFLKKSEIIKLGNKLNVPYRLTWSCYRGEKKPCGECDACLLRQKGFRQAGLNDPLQI